MDIIDSIDNDPIIENPHFVVYECMLSESIDLDNYDLKAIFINLYQNYFFAILQNRQQKEFIKFDKFNGYIFRGISTDYNRVCQIAERMSNMNKYNLVCIGKSKRFETGVNVIKIFKTF